MLKPKTTLILIAATTFVCLGITIAQAQQQPLWGFPAQSDQTLITAQPGAAPVQAYAPREPLANSDPGTLEPPALIARNLNEDDASYTMRMKNLQEQLLRERDQLMLEHDEAMKRVARIGGAGNGPVVSEQPAPTLPADSTKPADQYGTAPGRRVPGRQLDSESQQSSR